MARKPISDKVLPATLRLIELHEQQLKSGHTCPMSSQRVAPPTK